MTWLGWFLGARVVTWLGWCLLGVSLFVWACGTRGTDHPIPLSILYTSP